MKNLIVDDEQDVEILFQQKFRRELKSKSLEVNFAFSGKEALRLLGEQDSPAEVYVLSDIYIPGMTGLELLEKVKTRFSNIHFSMVSACGDMGNYEKAIKSGAKGFFSKLVDFESLKKATEELLTHK